MAAELQLDEAVYPAIVLSRVCAHANPPHPAPSPPPPPSPEYRHRRPLTTITLIYKVGGGESTATRSFCIENPHSNTSSRAHPTPVRMAARQRVLAAPMSFGEVHPLPNTPISSPPSLLSPSLIDPLSLITPFSLIAIPPPSHPPSPLSTPFSVERNQRQMALPQPETGILRQRTLVGGTHSITLKQETSIKQNPDERYSGDTASALLAYGHLGVLRSHGGSIEMESGHGEDIESGHRDATDM